MSSLSRRTVLQTLGGAGLTAAAGAATSGLVLSRGVTAQAAKSLDPVFTFVSLPDFMNGDVADLQVLPTWDGGANSVNQSWEGAMERALLAVADVQPDAVFLAGDMVEGRWNVDTENRQLFGPVNQGIDPESIAMCKSAITSAGGVYYSYHADLFASHDLPLYPAVGDHEILDDRPGPLNDRWNPSGVTLGQPDNRYYLVDHAKSVWADHFTRPGGVPRFTRRPVGTAAEFSAYSVSFADALTLITVDTFMRTAHGVRLGVFDAQLRWLQREIRRAKRRGHVVVVQGHIPVMHPTRWWASGRLRVPEGRQSVFYQVLRREGVDVYLCGEVHDSTVIQHGRRAPVQISHGCIFEYGFSYLVGRLYPDRRLVLDLYEIPLVGASLERELWCTQGGKSQRTFLEYGAPAHRGRLVQQDREVLRRTAKLGRYDRNDDPYDLRHHSQTQPI
ncbi:MAG TPA: metallophosphoesterase [Nocardioides sp.]|nr:metallophosphoesterase [Nocardioides sp.]